MLRMSADADRPSRLILSLISGMLIFIVAFAGILYYVMEKQAEIVIDGNSQAITTLAFTVADALEENDIHLNPNDLMDADPDSILKQNQVVNISRAFAVEVMADGETHVVNSTALTVAQALDMAGVSLGELDKISQPLGNIITQADNIEITRVTTEYYKEEVKIDPPTQRKDDDSLEKGITRVVSKGKSGVRENTYEIVYENGVEVARELVDTAVLEQPVAKVVAQGTIAVASRGGNTFNFSEARVVTATAYTATGNRTATGTWPKVGTIAVDPRVIPYKTKVYVEGYGYAVAEDTGGAIKGAKIDVYLDTESACRQWGRKTVKIYILN